ncbi:MAG TPA: hypothetical protein VGK53_03205, partial [Propionicimonas sp.]
MGITTEWSRSDVEADAAAIRIVRYSSIDDVPVTLWDQLAGTGAVGLEAGHLRAVEVSRINDAHPYYFVGLKDGRPVGIAYCFAMDLDLTRLTSQDPPDVLATVKAWQPDFMKVRVLEVGHLASLGATVEAAPGLRAEFLRSLAPELEQLARVEDADLGVV